MTFNQRIAEPSVKTCAINPEHTGSVLDFGCSSLNITRNGEQMKLATILLISVLASFAPLMRPDAHPASEVALDFTGGASWTSSAPAFGSGIFPVFGNEDWARFS